MAVTNVDAQMGRQVDSGHSQHVQRLPPRGLPEFWCHKHKATGLQNELGDYFLHLGEWRVGPKDVRGL